MNPLIAAVVETTARIILGKTHAIKLALTCLLARGHLLIEDIPGVGKTTFANALARCVGLSFQRIQFTSDLLPSDITGLGVYDQQKNQFTFRPGPIFSQCLLADEINRSSPKTQSALLEAMEEQQVSVDGLCHRLPEPFFVIATQNPAQQIGTYSLPESQLDRFLMRVSLGYPDPGAERQLLKGHERDRLLFELCAPIDAKTLLLWQQQVRAHYVDERILDYVQNLLDCSRSRDFVCGLSPRAGMALIGCAKAWSWVCNRPQVIPEDVQAVLPEVANHRLQFNIACNDGNIDPATQLMQAVAVP